MRGRLGLVSWQRCASLVTELAVHSTWQFSSLLLLLFPSSSSFPAPSWLLRRGRQNKRCHRSYFSWYRSRIKLLLPPCPYSSLLPSTGHPKLEISVRWSSMSNWYMHRWSRHDRDICNSVMIAIRYRYFDLSINLKESPDIWSTTSTRMNWNLSGICPKFSWISDGTGNFTLI